MGKWRMNYLMEVAWDYIVNGDMFEDFINEYSLSMYEEEMQYFKLSKEQMNWMKEEGYIKD